ncbi:MAG: polysaccharide biosynthesis tyrosine autokinase, partial [Actinomycetota bacterium]
RGGWSGWPDELRVRRQELRGSLDQLQRQVGQTDATTPSALQAQLDETSYELDLVEAQAQATTSSLTDLDLQAELAAVGEARMVQVAGPPRAPSNTPIPLLVAMGALLGLLLGVGLAVLIEAFDRTIKTAADVADVTDLPVLASIPRTGRRAPDPAFAIVEDPEGLVANAYHKVRSSLEFVGLESEINSILVTSANASEGKSTTSSNLALAFASVGNQTVLIDVDFRRPRLHTLYQVDQAPGLSDYILYGAALARVAHPLQEPGIAEMRIIPSGTVPPSPAALIGTKSFQETVDWIASHAEIVTLDAPPLLAVPDALSLGQQVDAVVVTARAGQTTKDELREVVGMLRQIQAKVAGVVLIGVAEADSYGKGYEARTA